MRQVFVTRPVEVEADQWLSVDSPPDGVHDVWSIPGTTASGYISTPEGDKIVHLGDCIVYWSNGDIDVMSFEDFRKKVERDKPEHEA